MAESGKRRRGSSRCSAPEYDAPGWRGNGTATSAVGRFPWETHARGFIGHLVFGAAADAPLEWMALTG